MSNGEESTSMIELSDDSNSNVSEEQLALTVVDKSISSDDKSVQSDSRQRSFNVASILLILAINVSNFVNGLYMAVPGPTLLFLAERVSVDVSKVSIILAGRSAGNLLGAFAATVIRKHRTKYWNRSMKLGLSFVFYAVTTLTIPFIDNIWILVANLSLGGFLFGFNNTGFLAMQLDIWGEKKSRPLMQLYQGIFSIGAMLAPLIASPFLNMADDFDYKKPDIPVCFKRDVNNLSLEFVRVSMVNETSYEDITETPVNPVAWVYVIIGCLSLLAAVFMIVLSLGGVEDAARCGDQIASEAREEEPLLKVALLLLCVTCFYAFQVAAINVFASYIYSVAFCSKLQFSVSEASSLNSLYWGVIILGRVAAFLVAAKIRPATLITSCIITLAISTVLMSAMGESHVWVAWSATALWALGISPLFGSGVSWVSQITNVSGRYAVIFEFGAAIGAVGAFPVGGLLFDNNPFYVIYFVSGLIGMMAVSFVGMCLTGRSHRSKNKDAKSLVNFEKK